jgi:hypothetical protein
MWSPADRTLQVIMEVITGMEFRKINATKSYSIIMAVPAAIFYLQKASPW